MESSDVLALLAIAVSLISAVYGFRLSRRAHYVSTYTGVISLFRELDRTFIEYPDLRPYFYDGKPVGVDDPNHNRVQAAAELVLDTFEWIWYRQENLNAEDEKGWQTYIAETYFSSPALQQHYTRYPSWYPGIARLIADHKNVPTETGRVGPVSAGRGALAPDITATRDGYGWRRLLDRRRRVV